MLCTIMYCLHWSTFAPSDSLCILILDLKEEQAGGIKRFMNTKAISELSYIASRFSQSLKALYNHKVLYIRLYCFVDNTLVFKSFKV